MKHKIDVLLHALEEVSRWSDNSTISSLASLVALIHMMGSEEFHEPSPKPSTVVFMTDKFKEYHGDQPLTDVSQTASVQVGTPKPSKHNNDGSDATSHQDGAWLSPSSKHMAAVAIPTGEAKMDIDTGNWYAVLKSLGKMRNRSTDQSSPDNRKHNNRRVKNATKIIFHKRVAWSRYWPVNLPRSPFLLEHPLLFRSTQLMVTEWEGPLFLT